jgi:hypothetical protein
LHICWRHWAIVPWNFLCWEDSVSCLMGDFPLICNKGTGLTLYLSGSQFTFPRSLPVPCEAPVMDSPHCWTGGQSHNWQ